MKSCTYGELTEHYIFVKRWRSVYRLWNEFNSWVARKTKYRVEPVFITDELFVQRFMLPMKPQKPRFSRFVALESKDTGKQD